MERNQRFSKYILFSQLWVKWSKLKMTSLKQTTPSFPFLFFFSFFTQRSITPVRRNLHEFALSAARDLELLPFLLRQFCGVNCKVTVCVFAAKNEIRALRRQNWKNHVNINCFIYKEYHWTALKMNSAVQPSHFLVTWSDLQYLSEKSHFPGVISLLQALN